MTAVALHPAEYSPEVLAVLAAWLDGELRVHDPFAGCGVRLGALCDRLGIVFTGTDVEAWVDADSRVVLGDATDPTTYPTGSYTVTTSPPYLNGISADYKNGPTARTDTAGRRAYGISKGGPLHERNLARLVVAGINRNPTGIFDEFYAGLGDAVRCWGPRVLLNVDAPMCERSQMLLEDAGYSILDVVAAATKRYRGVANADRRPDREVVIAAVRHGDRG